MALKKNGLSVTYPFEEYDQLNRWLFQQSALAVKHGLVEVPVMLSTTSDYSIDKPDWMRGESFEAHLRQLDLLAPLSHPFPFIVIGYSDKEIARNPEVIELEFNSEFESVKPVVDKFIEFSPEYHQAGLGILNYFTTYLREQYPEQDALVKIEQHGLSVRMIIETKNGERTIVEKALHEYELIVSGEEPPEKYSYSKIMCHNDGYDLSTRISSKSLCH